MNALSSISHSICVCFFFLRRHSLLSSKSDHCLKLFSWSRGLHLFDMKREFSRLRLCVWFVKYSCGGTWTTLLSSYAEMNALKLVTWNLFYSFFISMLLARILQLLLGQTLHNFIDILECFQQNPATSPFQLSWSSSSLVCYVWFGSSCYLFWFINLYVMFGLDVLYLFRINTQKRNSLVFVWSRGGLLYALQARLFAINLLRLIAKKPELASLQHQVS